MIVYYLGIPGSGKTYSAVNTIYNNFSDDTQAKKDLKKDYINCYTNINEFKFDKIKNVFNLDLDDFYEKLKILHSMSIGKSLDVTTEIDISVIKDDKQVKISDNDDDVDVSDFTMEQFKQYKKSKRDNDENLVKKSPEKKQKLKKATDEQLINKAKELNIYKTLFVIDECHNFFDTNDVVKIWWLTYHRHLYHDIILITQNLSLVYSKYKPLAEAFYKAKPNSLTLIKMYFNYTYFTDSRMSDSSKVNVLKVKKNQKVFELYKSGDSVKSKNVILYFLGISLILLIIFGLFAFYYTKQTDDRIKEQKQNEHHEMRQDAKKISRLVLHHDDSILLYDNKKLISLSCSYSSCTFSNFSYPTDLIQKFINDKNLNVIYRQSINKAYFRLFVSSSSDFYDFLISIKGVTNDKNVNNDAHIDLFSSK